MRETFIKVIKDQIGSTEVIFFFVYMYAKEKYVFNRTIHMRKWNEKIGPLIKYIKIFLGGVRNNVNLSSRYTYNQQVCFLMITNIDTYRKSKKGHKK